MAVPAKPQSRRNKPAPAIFANPSAEPTPFVSGTATFADAAPAPEPLATMTAIVDPVAVGTTVEQIAVPAVEAATDTATDVAQAATEATAEVVEAGTDAAVATLDRVENQADAVVAQTADIAQDVQEIGERNLETVTAHRADPNPVSAFSKGYFPMATAFDTSKTQDMVGDFSNRTKGALEKGVKFAEDMTEFTKGNVEAIVASGRVAAKGIEALAQDAAETAKSNFEQVQTALKSFTQVKSPTELFQLQSDYAKTAFDQLVANTSKASEQMMKLLGDVAQPLSNRYALAAEKVKSAAL